MKKEEKGSLYREYGASRRVFVDPELALLSEKG